MQLDRYKTHDIELVIDRLEASKKNAKRLSDTIQLALKQGKGNIMIVEKGKEDQSGRFFSKNLMCPTSGIAYDDPAPNSFSFNSPYGACPQCNGLGTIAEIDQNKIIPKPNKSIKSGGILPLGEYSNRWIFRQIETILQHYNFTLNTAIKSLSQEALNTILYGTNSPINILDESSGKRHFFEFEGMK